MNQTTSALLRLSFADHLQALLVSPLALDGNFALVAQVSSADNQQQTNDAFSDKWSSYAKSSEKEGYYAMQRAWYLKLYGFASEEDLATYLKKRPVIFDAGCGLGF